MDAYEQWITDEIKKLRLDAGMLSDKGRAVKETLEAAHKKYTNLKDKKKSREYLAD